ncbi:M24 family metallopeptidase [Tepidamorphus sp. 3E244]|uniref:M24 family metallopeptidase n=1 Tax=Tepidamorphus sp. 3E244 TaxID=3385498 RepID=UPI0038FC0081
MDAARGFAQGEFEHRLSRAQKLMDEAGFDALLLTSEPDVRYFTGFLTRFWESPTRPWFVIVPLSGKPVAVIPQIGAHLMGTTWVEDIRTWAAPDMADDGVSLLGDTLLSLAGEKGCIGLPMGLETHLRMPLADFFRVRDSLPRMTFTDAAPLLRALQCVKSEAEIDKIRAACAIGSAAFDMVSEFAHEGVPLSTIFRRFQMALLEKGADWVPYLAGGAGLDGYGDVISPAGDQPLMAGDVLMLDTGAVFDGYFCDFDRNWAIAHASEAASSAYDVLFGATEAGFAAARPGETAASIYHAMDAVISVAGGDGGGGRLGHGLGMRLTEWPSLIPADHTVLEPGMVLTLEPGLEVSPGIIQVHEENIVIRENGAEWLTRRAAEQLPVIG